MYATGPSRCGGTPVSAPLRDERTVQALLSQGRNALNVAFDLPSQMGLNSDDPRAEGEVGRVGMAVDTLKDMEVAFEGIPIDKTRFTSHELRANGYN